MRRRDFLASSALFASSAGLARSDDRDWLADRFARIDAAAAEPVLRRELFAEPVRIASVELLERDGEHLCRVRSDDGSVGLSVSNSLWMNELHPVFVRRVAPAFVGRDARDLESLLVDAYRFRSNYKMRSLAVWVPVATVEFAILDLLGRRAGVPVGALLTQRPLADRVEMYRANNNRGRSVAETLESVRRLVANSGATALKIKVGGRMGEPERPPGRTRRLIPAIREAFPDLTLFADANGGYDAAEAIDVARRLEEHDFELFEAPVPPDWYDAMAEVTAATAIRTAGGEQEPSLRRFRWMMAHAAFDVYQPDLFYFGGMIRCVRVARMAAAVGAEIIPHISGVGLGLVYMLHYVSAIANATRLHEYKGVSGIPVSSETSLLHAEFGQVAVPSGPGLGVTLDADWVNGFRPIGESTDR